MEIKKEIHIIHRGAASPLGINAATNAANLDYGLSRIMPHPWIKDLENNKPVIMGIASWLDNWDRGINRFKKLVSPAFNESLEIFSQLKLENKNLYLAVGLPEKTLALPAGFEDKISSFLEEAAKKSELKLNIETISKGNASSLTGLRRALIKLEKEEIEFAIVGGIECMNSEKRVELLQESGRLRNKSNPWGIIPGEAAGFWVICSKETALKYSLKSQAKILGLGEALEENTINTESICLGRGLTKAIKAALIKLPAKAKINQTFCDRNSERYRADEFGFMALRLGNYFDNINDFIAPVGKWGDIGAATVPLLINQTIFQAENGVIEKPYSLIWAASDNGERAALTLELSLENINPNIAQLKTVLNLEGEN